MGSEYNVESYWSDVAKRIAKRKQSGLVAGDDEPFYAYKRKMFLKMLHTIDFSSKKVLEVGSGPGGNLIEVNRHSPKELVGVDVSSEMVDIAKNNCPASVIILKINGTNIPFDSNYFDIVFTATVLQHNTNQAILNRIIQEIARVSKDRVYYFERIEHEIIGDDLNEGRPISYYEGLMKSNGFILVKTKFINIQTSYYMAGFIRKVLNRKSRKEGEPLNIVSTILQRLFLPITQQTDKLFKSNRDLAMLEFQKIK